MFKYVLEFLAFCGVIYLVVFQVIIPAFQGIKLFPAFRKSDIEEQLLEVEDSLREVQLKAELKHKEQILKSKQEKLNKN
jgi:hypothetical protein